MSLAPPSRRLAAGLVWLAACGPAPRRPRRRWRPADEVREIVGALAADSMEGRRTGTPGSARAARFLAERMRRYGLEPGGDSSYFQRVPYEVVRGPEGEVLRLPGARRADTAAGRAGHRLQPDRPGPRLGSGDAGRGRGARRPLRSPGDRQAGGGRLDLQRGRRRRLRAWRRCSPRPARWRRRRPSARSSSSSPAARSPACWAPSGTSSSPTFPLDAHRRRSAGGDGRPARLAGGRPGQALAHRLRALHHGREPSPRPGSRWWPIPRPEFRFFERSDNIVFALRGIPGAHAVLLRPALRLPPAVGRGGADRLRPPGAGRRPRWPARPASWPTARAPTWHPGGRPSSCDALIHEGPRPRLDPQAHAWRAGGTTTSRGWARRWRTTRSSRSRRS